MQIFLITPKAPDAAFADICGQVLATGGVSALLVRSGGMADRGYEALAKALLPVTRKHDVALLLDNRADLVRPLGADGVHVSGGARAFADAAESLKPEFIVGAADLHSRHEAMLRGEAGADYLFFGPEDGEPADEDLDLVDWWSEMFEIPCVLPATHVAPDDLQSHAAEFIALGDNIWSAPQGAVAAMQTATARVGAEA